MKEKRMDFLIAAKKKVHLVRIGLKRETLGTRIRAKASVILGGPTLFSFVDIERAGSQKINGYH